jgi:hypothetical protein
MTSKLAVAVVGSCLTASAAWAGSQLEDTVSNCSTINCGAMILRGVHQTNEPFVVQVFSAEGECLRLDVDSQTQDMAMTIVAPAASDGVTVDDRDDADLRPLFFQDGMPGTGWYTVVIGYFDYAPTQGKFILKYGRYAAGNANCPAVAVTEAAQLKAPSAFPAKVASPPSGSEE